MVITAPGRSLTPSRLNRIETTIMNAPPASTYEGQLAERAAELLPGADSTERLELLGAMDPDDLGAALAFSVSQYPQVFDFALVRDRAMVGRLRERVDEPREDAGDLEPYCLLCSASIGIFIGHGHGWHHYTGQGTVASPVELFDAGHDPAIAWREAGAR